MTSLLYFRDPTSDLLSSKKVNPLTALEGFDYRPPAIFGLLITNYSSQPVIMGRKNCPDFTPICVCKVVTEKRRVHIRSSSVAISQISALLCCVYVFCTPMPGILHVYLSASGSCHQLSVFVGE